MRDLLSCEAWNKNKSQPGALSGKVLGVFPKSGQEDSQENSPEDSQEKS
jgi:hypothetical protein